VLVGVLGGTGMSSFYLLSASTVAHWFHDRRGSRSRWCGRLQHRVHDGAARSRLAHRSARLAARVRGDRLRVRDRVAARGHQRRLPRAAERVTARPVGATTAAGGITQARALRDPRFWTLNVSWLLLGSVIFTLSVHAVPFARDQGVSLARASLALTAYGIGSVLVA
jgi:hypothetical protein